MTQTLENPLVKTAEFLQNPPQRFAEKDEVIAYVLFKLLERPHYALEMQHLITSEAGLKTSATIFAEAMRYLEEKSVVYRLGRQPLPQRGRSGINYAIADHYRALALEISALWCEHIKRGQPNA